MTNKQSKKKFKNKTTNKQIDDTDLKQRINTGKLM